MGKLKRGRKNQKARVNPLGNKSQAKQGDKDESSRQSKILPLINRLKSTVPNDKSMALGAITVLCEDERMRKLLLKEKLVSIIMEQCMNDSNDEIIVESFGLLRNLGIEEGYDVVKYYWRSNIWTSIEAALNKIQTSFKYLEETFTETNKKKDDKAKTQLLYDLTENVLSLIVVIASGSDELYESVFNKIDPVLKFVIDLINWNMPNFKVSLKLFNSLLEFIYEFSSESAEFIKKLSNVPEFNLNKLIAFFNSSGQSKNKLGKIYLEGIKFNIYEALSQIEDKNKICSEILNNIFEILTSIDMETLKTNLTVPDNANKPIQKTEVITQQISGDTVEQNQAKSDLESLENALDIITSIFEYLSLNESEIQEPVSLSNDMIEVLLKKTYPLLVELLKFDQINNGILSLTEKNLVSLNNLAWLFLSNETIPVVWFERSLELWDIIIELSSKDSLVIQKSCLNVLWAIAKSIGPEVQSKISNDIIDSLIQKCDNIVKNIDDKEIDQNASLDFVLSTVGFLGTLAPMIGNTESTLNISEFLLSLIEFFSSNSSNALNNEISIECLNSIYDIFGDKDFEYDYEIFVQHDYLNKLAHLEPKVKEMYKRVDKNKNEQLKLRAEETWINLGRFIQYKGNERL